MPRQIDYYFSLSSPCAYIGHKAFRDVVATPAPAKSNGAPQIPAAPVAEEDGNLPDGVKASPVARKIAAEKGIDLGLVKGTGPGGRIVKDASLADVVKFLMDSTNTSILLATGVDSKRRVTLECSDVPLDSMLGMLCEACSLRFDVTDDMVVLRTP